MRSWWPLLLILTFASVPAAGDESGVVLAVRPLPPRYNECQLCHLKKKLEYIPSKHTPHREHEGYLLLHGKHELSCNACHDAGKSNYLRATAEFPANFANSSPVCQRCHSERYRDWLRGEHGRRTGHWNGEKVSEHCITCHNAHSVVFKPMVARPAPVRPHLGVDKELSPPAPGP